MPTSLQTVCARALPDLLRPHTGAPTEPIDSAAASTFAVSAGWDFDRVILAHGEVIEHGGKQAVLDVFG